jgi:hypothetical protein
LASNTLQSEFLVLASVLQWLRGAAWFTAGVILGAQAADPSIAAGVSVLRNLMLSSGVLALLCALFLLNGALQVWAGYQVSMWRKTRLWLLAGLIPALDCIAWAEIGLRLEARGESGFAAAGFVFCGLAALAAIGMAAGRSSLSGRF